MALNEIQQKAGLKSNTLQLEDHGFFRQLHSYMSDRSCEASTFEVEVYKQPTTGKIAGFTFSPRGLGQQWLVYPTVLSLVTLPHFVPIHDGNTLATDNAAMASIIMSAVVVEDRNKDVTMHTLRQLQGCLISQTGLPGRPCPTDTDKLEVAVYLGENYSEFAVQWVTVPRSMFREVK